MHVTIESTMTADTSLVVLQMWPHKPNDNEEVIIEHVQKARGQGVRWTLLSQQKCDSSTRLIV